jgi:hypothetical protein
MDIIQSIKKDHQEVKGIFQRLAKAKGEKSAATDFSELRKELIPHMKAEEKIFYSKLMDEEHKEDILEGYEEHHASEMVLKELEKTSMDDERWPAKLKVLKEMIEHHIKEEESKILKIAQSSMDKNQLQQLGEKFDSSKEELRKKL